MTAPFAPSAPEPPSCGHRRHAAGCVPCRERSASYDRYKRRQKAYGRWQPYVDAAPAREHVRMLQAAGIGWQRIARIAGVSPGSVDSLLYARSGHAPSRLIRAAAAERLLAVRPSLDLVADTIRVDATGTRRRLQALIALGHSQGYLGRRLGASDSNFRLVMARAQVTAGRARAVRGLYDELWDVPPDESTPALAAVARAARRRALDAGWPLPAAWDDQAIDNPDAPVPEGWQRESFHGGQRAEDVAEDALELLARHYTRAEAAERLGVKRNTLDKAIERARRRSESEDVPDAA